MLFFLLKIHVFFNFLLFSQTNYPEWQPTGDAERFFTNLSSVHIPTDDPLLSSMHVMRTSVRPGPQTGLLLARICTFALTLALAHTYTYTYKLRQRSHAYTCLHAYARKHSAGTLHHTKVWSTKNIIIFEQNSVFKLLLLLIFILLSFFFRAALLIAANVRQRRARGAA